MSIAGRIRPLAAKVLKELYNYTIPEEDITISSTKPEFEGDYTMVLFSFVKQLKKSPEELGKELGENLVAGHPDLFSAYNVIKGFLNLTIKDDYWLSFLNSKYNDPQFGNCAPSGKKVMVEYSSPNTNKPLHLGHLRNNFLGWSVAAILKANGNDIVKTCIANDRGIHICKSMIAWQLFANGATPETTGLKGDHFVGDYYVRFGEELKKQSAPIVDNIAKNNLITFSEEEKVKIEVHLSKIENLRNALTRAVSGLDMKTLEQAEESIKYQIDSAINATTKWKVVNKLFDLQDSGETDQKKRDNSQKKIQQQIKPLLAIEEKIDTENEEIKDIAENKTAIMIAAKKMLVDWEAGKPDVIELWKKMNSWVYSGFDITYKRIGTDFDKIYYESETYIPGKKLVEFGLQKGVFYKKDDGSVWIDLTGDGLDEKIVQRKDGTAVYITQDIGLAVEKQEQYKCDQSIYVVGDEQNYHFKVLKLICQKLELPASDGIYHLSYGMVELPTGRMKTREGTVVDADEIISEMVNVAKQKTEALGKVKDFTDGELKELVDIIGLGALKFFLLRVDPKKKMLFNPEESIDFHGFTGPFVQYTHARIKSILRKEKAISIEVQATSLLPLEKKLIVSLEQYPAAIEQASIEHNPSVLAIYAFNIAKEYNTFYTEHSVMNAESPEKKQLRLQLCEMTANVIAASMSLLGIKVPERM